MGGFPATTRIREYFLHKYLQDAHSRSLPRLSLYLGMVFLQSLFYELCILKTGNFTLIEPWLRNAERCLLGGEVTLYEDSERLAGFIEN